MRSFFSTGAFAISLVLPHQSNLTASTHCGTDLCTWWHDTGEVKTNSAMAPDAVRQSRQYLVQIMKLSGNDGNFPDDAGISIELDEGINMPWSRFEHSQDVDVRILRRDSQPVDVNVTIRPTALTLTPSTSQALWLSGFLRIRTATSFPWSSQTTSSPTSPAVMLYNRELYAFLPGDLVPALGGPDTEVMTPGAFSLADIGGAPIVYFPPGVYWIDSEPLGLPRIRLDPSIYWVHLAPGAFVKGAVEYTTANKDFYATGHDALSGEIYVYQANADKRYAAEKRDLTSVRMWWHRRVQGSQVWHSAGPTISSPPFSTMNLKDGSTGRDDISMEVFDYKQDAKVRGVFYHCNDDGIKTYHSGVTATDLVIWKVFNDPIIHMGWQSRDVHSIAIDTLRIIHTRYRKSETYVPCAIIGASPIYNGEPALDPSMAISMSISNVVCEDPCRGLFRLTLLENYADFKVTGVRYLDGLIGGSAPIGDSIIATADDTTYSGSEDLIMGLQIEDWTVGEEKVTMDNPKDLGRWNINAAFDGQWSIV
ncbi:glycoside hydrolase, family 49 [Aspergillus lentulus]|uniref:glycoside hydrolase, family 49 n=1 Tax=Aspergillus lentulus TaxID=293939 RepID=UPI0013928706|nr:glycoside hydrolase, family 49 [Aspergillus lentulus]GFF53182.1 glycoside hydrolase, family 49 [Aspergillus lentulus]